MADRPYPEPPEADGIYFMGGARPYGDAYSLSQVHAMIDADRRAAPAPGGDEKLLAAIQRCRYPVCKSINPVGWGWDVPRLNEVLDAAIADAERVKP